jgi:hypothetical protein
MQFANAFAHLETGLPQPNYYITPPSSPQPYRGAVRLGESPLPPLSPINIRRNQAQAAQRNENLRSLRAIAPNVYEENGTIVIPPARRRLAAPALHPRVRPVVREPVSEDPTLINSNSNNSNSGDPRPPTRSTRTRRRRITRRRRARR